MISEHDKKLIVEAILSEKERLGSFAKVAKKCDCATATITNNAIKKENQHLVSTEKWLTIATALGVKFDKKRWNLADISNLRRMNLILQDAQDEALFIGVSSKAGSGKTASISAFKQNDFDHMVFTISCEEWARRTFLLKVCQLCGLDTSKGYQSVDILTGKVVRFFKEKAKFGNPLLILDEADKLRPTSLRFIITFFNQLEDECGLVIAGTENLKKEIKKGVKFAKKGYDEIDSRMGRNYISLKGATLQDVTAICALNGVSDSQEIQSIFNQLNPIQVQGGNDVIEDLRRLKRLVKRSKLMAKRASK